MPIDVFVFKLLQCSVFVFMFVFMIEGIFAGAAALYACGCVCFLVCVFLAVQDSSIGDPVTHSLTQ